jgi:YHS domain-containing protein
MKEKPMKATLALLIVAALSGAALAQKPTAAAKPKAKPMTCSVMPTNKVDVADATKKHMYADYKGNRYFFCCEDCPKAFKANPAKFAKAPHIKTPKTK